MDNFWDDFGGFFVMIFGTNLTNNFMDNFLGNLFFHPCADQNLSNEDRAKHYFKMNGIR